MTRPIQVGFDYDEPIYPWYDLAHQACIKAGVATPDHEPTSWAAHEEYGISAEDWYAVIDNEILHGDMYHQPLDPAIVAMIKRLYTRGYGIHIITARGGFGPLGETIKQITRSQIIEAGLPYNTLTFTKDKATRALELGLDYFLDDHPKNYDPMDAAGINVWLLNERWNIPWDDHRRRVSSTKEYVDMILDKHGFQNVLTPEQRRSVSV